jgi:hypothetical protein
MTLGKSDEQLDERQRHWTDEPNRTCHSVRKKWHRLHTMVDESSNKHVRSDRSSTIRSREKAAMSHHGG